MYAGGGGGGGDGIIFILVACCCITGSVYSTLEELAQKEALVIKMFKIAIALCGAVASGINIHAAGHASMEAWADKRNFELAPNTVAYTIEVIAATAIYWVALLALSKLVIPNNSFGVKTRNLADDNKLSLMEAGTTKKLPAVSKIKELLQAEINTIKEEGGEEVARILKGILDGGKESTFSRFLNADEYKHIINEYVRLFNAQDGITPSTEIAGAVIPGGHAVTSQPDGVAKSR